MTFKIICSQGRVGDRTERMIRGAKLTAEALAQRYQTTPTYVGTPSPAKADDWTIALAEAASTLDQLQAELSCCLQQSQLPVIFASNTCSASLATLPVVAAANPDIKVLWIDAHSDFNTPDTTESGYLGGMVLAAACGQWESGYGSGIRPSNVALIGVHDIDENEQQVVNQAGVLHIPPIDLTLDAVLDHIGESKVWIHVDWDVLEPGQISADFKVNGGLALPQIFNLFRAIPREQVMGLELAEFCADDHPSKANRQGTEHIIKAVEMLFNTGEDK